MIVCVCKNLNSRQLQDCLGRGMSIEDISEEMGLGTGCGSCLEYACHLSEVNSLSEINNQSGPQQGLALIAREGTAA